MRAAALPLRRVEECMGTVFSFDVRAPGVQASDLDEVVEWLHWVDATFSTYRPDSEISRLASVGANSAAILGQPEVRDVLARCAELHVDTDGYFDAYATGVLDPSGYVKGWAIQRASDMLIARGSMHHCVNGGGDVQTVGGQTLDEPWQVGIAHPLAPGQLAAVVIGEGLAVATSGSAERGAHIVDPATGANPAYWSSITLVGRRIAECDAYATASFAMGEAAKGWIGSLADYEAFGVTVDGRSWASPGLC